MNVERLQQMVAMLRGLPPTHHIGFDLTDWHCGTAACAVGHACLSPWFQAEGLSLRQDWGGVTPMFGDFDGWEAVEKFFGLSNDDAEHLFYRWKYPKYGVDTTAPEVADRIEQFIAEHAEA